MYEITEAVTKFHDEITDTLGLGDLSNELTRAFFGELLRDAKANGELLDESDESSGEVGSLATMYVDVVPRFDKIKEAFAKLNED